MADQFKAELRIGPELNLGYSADQFEDWRDCFESLLSYRL